MTGNSSTRSEQGRRVILERLRRNTTPEESPEQRLPAGPPARMYGDLRDQFARRVKASKAILVEVESLGEVLAQVRETMDQLQLHGPIVTGSDPGLHSLRESSGSESSLFAHRGFEEGDQVALSRATAGIAETGTLALVSGPENPVSLNYLPELQIVLLAARDLFPTLDELWPHLRECFGDGAWPRSFNLVTGPSRTADVEQTIQLGAHGPRNLLLILHHDHAR